MTNPILLVTAGAMAICVLLSAPVVHAGAVISNESVSALTIDDAKQVFAGSMQSKNGTHLAPIENSSEQANFLSKVMNIDLAKYQNHWTKKAFREGLNPPPVNSSDVEVISFVKQTPGAVGYISGTAPAGVKLVATY